MKWDVNRQLLLNVPRDDAMIRIMQDRAKNALNW